MPAENFSFKANGMAWSVHSEKFVRPDLSRTEIPCYGLAECKSNYYKVMTNNFLQNNIDDSVI